MPKSSRWLPLLAAFFLCAGCASGRRSSPYETKADSEYSHRLHQRFYREWVQPRDVSAPPGRVSVPVDVEIERDGRVRRFRIAKSSGYPAIDASVRAVGASVQNVVAAADDVAKRTLPCARLF